MTQKNASATFLRLTVECVSAQQPDVVRRLVQDAIVDALLTMTPEHFAVVVEGPPMTVTWGPRR